MGLKRTVVYCTTTSLIFIVPLLVIESLIWSKYHKEIAEMTGTGIFFMVIGPFLFGLIALIYTTLSMGLAGYIGGNLTQANSQYKSSFITTGFAAVVVTVLSHIIIPDVIGTPLIRIYLVSTAVFGYMSIYLGLRLSSKGKIYNFSKQ